MSAADPTEAGASVFNSVRLRHRCLAEFIGTFALVFAGCGSIITGAVRPETMSSLGIAGVFGAVVAAMIYAVGPVSAAHFNPAVTLGFVVAGRFPRYALPYYWASQFAGAIAASGCHLLIFGMAAREARFGATIPWAAPLPALMLEILMTGVLMFVIMGVASDRRAHAATPGIAIGLAVYCCAAFGGPITGASLNPARSLGPALFAGGPALAWLGLYLLGPCGGAILGALAYEAVRGDEAWGINAPGGLG